MVSSTIAHTWLGKLLCINYTDDTYLLIWRVSRILFGKKHVTKWYVCVCVCVCVCVFILGQHVEVPRLGVKSEL